MTILKILIHYLVLNNRNKYGKDHSTICHEGTEWGVEGYPFMTVVLVGVGGQWHIPAPLPFRRPDTYCTGGWVGLRTGLSEYGSQSLEVQTLDCPSHSELL